MCDRGVIVPHSTAASHKLHVAIAEWHHDEHRLRFAFGDQVVEDKICLSDCRPAARHVTPAVQQIQRRIRLWPFLIVSRTRIALVLTLPVLPGLYQLWR